MKELVLAGVCACVSSLCGAAEIAMVVKGDDPGTSSYLTGTNFSDHLPPVAGNAYKTAAFTMRSPNDTSTATNYVFAGDKLTISSGGSLLWKTGGYLTVNDLVLGGGAITHGLDNFVARLAGAITVSNASSFSALEPNSRDFIVYSTIKGAADLTVTVAYTNSSKQFSLMADNTGFTGKLNMRGAGKLAVWCEENLGGNPSAYASNQLDLAGTTLLATNTFALDDANRGISLSVRTDNPNSTGGVFEVNNAATVTVACAVSGAGPLVKRGNGTLVLAAANSYAGLTTVQGGALRLSPGVLPARSSAVVTGATSALVGEGALSNVTLTAGGRLGAERGGWALQNLVVQNTTNVTFALDLSQADPATPLIRVSGVLSKSTYQVFHFTVATNNAPAVPYKVLAATNLASYASYEFCVSPPWLGELSRESDGAGGQVLVFRPNAPEKIVYKSAGDLLGDTSFTNCNWSDGLPPSADKTYVSRSFEMRLPAGGVNTFPGRRLIFDGQNISLKGTTGMATITNLTMMNNASFSMTEPSGSRLSGDILLHPVLDAGKSFALQVNGWSVYRTLWLYSALYGYGDFWMNNSGNPALGNVQAVLLGANTNFFGRIRVDGHTNFWLRVTSETNLGGVPPLFRADQLSFNGGGLSVTNDVTLDDATRGITLMPNGMVAGTSTDTGAFTNGSTTAERTFDGGATLRPESNGVTLAVSCPITGAGRLLKGGLGTLVLGGANTYTGQTVIVTGALRPASTNALGSGPVLLKPAGRLVRRHPEAALPKGVQLGGPIAFEPGSAVRVEWADGYTVTRNVTVPLFTVPTAVAPDAAAVPVQHGLSNYHTTVVTSDAGGGQTLYSATLTYSGAVLILR